MTQEQSLLFTALVDKNWDLAHEKDIHKKMELAKEFSRIRKDLQDSMGLEEYERFVENGRKMFAPLK
jgi:hypothetical protein